MLTLTALYRYLESNGPEYAGKAIELRESIAGWLEYIPQTFPHYTRHTVGHSEEIISQASNLLFIDGDPANPVVNLSSIEAYSLIAASFLHDAGMVTSDEEKIEILQSDEWKDWAEGGGGGTSRYQEIRQLRDSDSPSEEALRNFIADVQTRYLIAEFVRLRHHFRSGRLVQQHQGELARFSFDDPSLTRTIEDICVSHGLSRHELEDDTRFPERRNIRGELINVRFVALVLRLADLLDMNVDRACPLLLNAASPLPAGSLAHWTQYQTINHRLVAHDRIEIHAECRHQSEHRYIQDWCAWLVSESENAKISMAHSLRHGNWIPPLVTMRGSDPTIRIEPSADASYVPSNWTLSLDSDIIMERLIFDLHSNSKVFLRELLQNALDATRCRLAMDLAAKSIEFDGSFTLLDKTIRDGYPIHIELQERSITNPLSGEGESRQVISISDNGLGMDKRVIENYFLQIGRSFYSSDEFRREFDFFASSQFGIGFLSTFAVSDHVEVDTLKAGTDEAIKLILTGPKNYLLSEHGGRVSPGTSIEILLRDKFQPGELTNLVESWCRRVEFSIFLNDLGQNSLVEAELPIQFEYSIPDVTKENSQFSVISYPIEREGIDGELYVFVHSTEVGDSWADWSWASHRYPTLHPEATVPNFPTNLTCINGISVGQGGGYSKAPMGLRLDFRHPAFQQSLTRNDLGKPYLRDANQMPEIESRWEEILSQHLLESPFANNDRSWIYKQQMVDQFPHSTFWENAANSVEYLEAGQQQQTSLNEFVKFQEFISTVEPYQAAEANGDVKVPIDYQSIGLSLPHLPKKHLGHLSNKHRALIFQPRGISGMTFEAGILVIAWKPRSSPQVLFERRSELPIEVTELPSNETIGFNIHNTTNGIYPCVVLNSEHPIVQWLIRIRYAAAENKHAITLEQYYLVMSMLLEPVRYYGLRMDRLQQYLDGWLDLPDLPVELYPPELELTRDLFGIPYPE